MFQGMYSISVITGTFFYYYDSSDDIYKTLKFLHVNRATDRNSGDLSTKKGLHISAIQTYLIYPPFQQSVECELIAGVRNYFFLVSYI